MNERKLEQLRGSWKEWVRRDVFGSPTGFNFDKALAHLREGRRLLADMSAQVRDWNPIFPQFMMQEKYRNPNSPYFWRTKADNSLSDADEELLKGVRHLETLLGYYETEQASEDASYLEDFADRYDVTVEKVIKEWGREDFDDSVNAADRAMGNRFFRNMKSMMTDLRNAERRLTSTKSASFHEAGLAEKSLEALFETLLPETPFANQVFAVGGYVRDEILEREPNDLDLVVEAQYGAQRFADYLHDLFPNATSEPEPLTLKYPIWHIEFTQDVEWDGQHFAVEGAALDISDTQGLMANETPVFGPIGEDVRRRDFTVNMLFKDLSTGKILDPTGLGKDDLKRGILRGYPDADALQAFADQPRRMLRLVRFMTKYDWEPDPFVEKALKMSVEHLAELEEETIQRELAKLKKAGIFEEAWDLMRKYGMLPYLQEVLDPPEGMTKTAVLAPHQMERKVDQVERAVDRMESKGPSFEVVSPGWDTSSGDLTTFTDQNGFPPQILMWNPLSGEMLLGSTNDEAGGWHHELYERSKSIIATYPGASIDDWVRAVVDPGQWEELYVYHWAPLDEYQYYFFNDKGMLKRIDRLQSAGDKQFLELMKRLGVIPRLRVSYAK